MHRVRTWKGPYLHHRIILQILLFLFLLLLPSACRKKPSSSDNNPPPQEYDPRNISRTEGNSYGPSIAVGTNGEVYVAWMEAGGLFFRYKGTDGNWSEIETLATMNWAPHLAADPFGNVHLVWEDHHDTTGVNPNYEIFYRMRRPDGTWTEVENISNNPGTSMQPRIAVDPSGTVHVVWLQGMGLKYRSKPIGGNWGVEETVPVGSQGAINHRICSDEEGGVHLVYEAADDIKYLYRSPTGEWSEPVNVSESQYISWYGSVAVDGSGNVYVLWTEEDWGAGPQTSIIYYSAKTENGWTVPDSIPGTRGLHGWPRKKILFFKGMYKYLLWGDGWYEIYLGIAKNHLSDSVAVIQPFEPPGSPYPDACMDSSGNIHVVWSAQNQYQNYEIFYNVITPTTK